MGVKVLGFYDTVKKMEQPKLINSESLLEKAARAQMENNEEHEEDIAAVKERLGVPFGSNVSGDGMLTVHIEGRPLHIAMEVPEDCDQEDVEYFRNYLSQRSEAPLTGECKKITSLQLEYSRTDIITHDRIRVADFFSLISKGCTIFYFPDSANQDGVIRWRDNTIAITGDIASPITLATLFHEMGHAVDHERLQKLGITSLVTEHEDKDHAEHLRKERVASAFALSILRRCLRNDAMKTDILTFLKDYALQSHYTGVIEKIRARQSMQKHMADDWQDFERLDREERESQMYYEGWEAWKDTEAHKKWKASGIHLDDTDPYNEFDTWRSWVEKTGYEFWKDLPEENETGHNENFKTMEVLWANDYENIEWADISNSNQIFFATKDGEEVFIKKYARSKDSNPHRANAELLSYQHLPPKILMSVIEINPEEEYIVLKKAELQDIELSEQSLPEVLDLLATMNGANASFAIETTWEAYEKVFEKLRELQKIGLLQDAEKIIQLFEQNRNLIENAPQVFSHHDFNARNFKKEGGRMVVFDFEYAAQDNAMVDLATLYIDTLGKEPVKAALQEKVRARKDYNETLFDLMIIRRCAILLYKYQGRDPSSEFFQRNLTAFNEAIKKYLPKTN